MASNTLALELLTQIQMDDVSPRPLIVQKKDMGAPILI